MAVCLNRTKHAAAALAAGLKASVSSTECRLCLTKTCTVTVGLGSVSVFGSSVCWCLVGQVPGNKMIAITSCTVRLCLPTSHVSSVRDVGVVNGGAYKDLKLY